MVKKIMILICAGAVLAIPIFCGRKSIQKVAQARPAFAQERFLAEAESDEDDEDEERDDDEFQATTEENIPTELPNAAESSVSAQPVGAETASSVPWYITRAAGIAAYILMFLIIVLGEGMTTGFAYSIMTPVRAWVSHKYLGIAFGVTLMVHMFSLLFDKFVSFSLVNILVPFSSGSGSLYLSLGIVSFYIVVAVLLSSLLVRLRFPMLWRKIHYLTYPLFVLAFIHGAFLGTDTKKLPMQVVHAITGSVFILILIHRWRFHLSRRQGK